MEYTSSEDDELVEDYPDLEEDVGTSDVDQRTGEVSVSLQFGDQVCNSMAAVEHPMGNVLLATDGVKNEDPYLGMEFDSDSTARAFYNAYALRLGFGVRVARSRSERRKGIEVLVMKRFVCLKEGHHKKKVTDSTIKKKRKRLSIRDGCPAMMEVVRRGPDKWVVTKLVLEHTHVVVSPDKVREIQLNHLSGKGQENANCLREMRQKIFGEGDAQGLLEYFKRMQGENSGFFYSMQVDNRNCMTNVFWVDAKARMAYSYFGDAVTFDTTYTKNENMMPFAAFTGVNHHGQPVVFGCALVIDKIESSYAWLFETWLTAMLGHRPTTFTTDQGKAMEVAVAKVFPNTCHRLCRWRILSRCKKKLSDVCSRYPTFYGELKKCVNESETVNIFEVYWNSILDKYGLKENTWLQLLHNIRHKWIPAYLKGFFFAELSATRKLESMNRFYRDNLDRKTSLLAFIAKFDQVMDDRYEKEAQEDLSVLQDQQILKTNASLEKQAANEYTRAVFEEFQVELIEALEHYSVKVQDRAISKFSVERDGNVHDRQIVHLSASEKKACCSCYKFDFAGILCRHVLAVFLVTDVILLPEHYILKRWTRRAKSGLILEDDHGVEFQNYCQNSPIIRYNDLVHDAMKCAEKGAACAETYKIVKHMLQKAFAEIVALEENMSKVRPHHAENMLKTHLESGGRWSMDNDITEQTSRLVIWTLLGCMSSQVTIGIHIVKIAFSCSKHGFHCYMLIS